MKKTEIDKITSNIKHRAERNRTLYLSTENRQRLRSKLISLEVVTELQIPPCGTIHGDCLQIASRLPKKCLQERLERNGERS
jgi:hypothetical protein